MSAVTRQRNNLPRAIFTVFNRVADAYIKGLQETPGLINAQIPLDENLGNVMRRTDISAGGNMWNASLSCATTSRSRVNTHVFLFSGDSTLSIDRNKKTRDAAIRAILPTKPPTTNFVDIDSIYCPPSHAHNFTSEIIPVAGYPSRIHYRDSSPDAADAIIKGMEFLHVPEEIYGSILDRMEPHLRGAAILGIDGLPNPFCLPFYLELQRRTKGVVPIFADTKEPYMRQILENSERDDCDRLIGFKQNLKEFCELEKIDHNQIIDLLEQNQYRDFEEIILRRAVARAKRHLIPGKGIFPLTCGQYRYNYVMTTDYTYKIRTPKVRNLVSAVGSGDSMVGNLISWLARGIALGISQLKIASAIPAATAERPFTQLGTLEEAEKYLAEIEIEVIDNQIYGMAA